MGTPRTPPLARTHLETAGAAPGSIIAPIIATHTARNGPNEPSRVATPMSIPFISVSATTQQAAASAIVAVSTAAVVGAGALRTRSPGAVVSSLIASSPFGFGQALDHAQSRFPSLRDTGDRPARLIESLGSQPVPQLASVAVRLDEAGAIQDRQVLGDRLARHRQLAGERGGGLLAPRDERG